MDPLSSHEEVEIPMPINSAYVGLLHNHHHHNHHHHEASLDITPPASNNAPTNSREDQRHQRQQSQGYHENYTDDDHPKRRVVVRYRECLKNHAATMGGNATDGCGEFMPSGPHEGGEGGGLGNLICSACNCHRNFHRKEIEGEQQQVVPHSSTTNTVPQFYPSTPHPVLLGGPRGRGVIFGTRPGATHHVDGVVPFSRTVPISMAYPASDDHSHDHHHRLVRKRFRTKFSPEQKEKMMEFAERVGWKIQRQEESVVQQFCQEIGVKRRVLKVWMHNNKHNLANKIINHNHDNNNSNDNHDNNNNHSSSSM